MKTAIDNINANIDSLKTEIESFTNKKVTSFGIKTYLDNSKAIVMETSCNENIEIVIDKNGVIEIVDNETIAETLKPIIRDLAISKILS